MKNVVGSLFISLDGIVESPDKWQFDGFEDAMMQKMVDQISEIDTVLLGRTTYEEWSPYFPASTDEPFASFINNVPKLVISSTLKSVEWGGFDTVRLLEGDLADNIALLKQQPGKNIGVSGSPTLVQSLLENDLLDELHLQIHPVIAGKGKRLFKDESALKRLKLIKSQTNKPGVIIVSYQVIR